MKHHHTPNYLKIKHGVKIDCYRFYDKNKQIDENINQAELNTNSLNNNDTQESAHADASPLEDVNTFVTEEKQSRSIIIILL